MKLHPGLPAVFLMGCATAPLFAQQWVESTAPVPAGARMRPIGAASAVDQFRRTSSSTRQRDEFQQTAYQWNAANEPSVLQVQGFALPPGAAPQTNDLIQQTPPSLSGTRQVLPPDTVPNNPIPAPRMQNDTLPPRPVINTPPLQTVPGNIVPNNVPNNVYPNSSYNSNPNWETPIATIDNSPYVTAPVRYLASQPCGCGPFMQTGYTTVATQGPPPIVPPGDFIAPPTLPPGAVPATYYGNDVGFKPLLSLGQENYNVVLGRGIIGQPTAYVPGQTFRNILRYLSP